MDFPPKQRYKEALAQRKAAEAVKVEELLPEAVVVMDFPTAQATL